MSEEPLLVEFGPGLAFCFENLPAIVARPLRDLFGAFIVERLSDAPLIISGGALGHEGRIAAEAAPTGGFTDNRTPAGGFTDNRTPAGGFTDNRTSTGGFTGNRTPAGGFTGNRTSTGGFTGNRTPAGGGTSNRGSTDGVSDTRASADGATDKRAIALERFSTSGSADWPAESVAASPGGSGFGGDRRGSLITERDGVSVYQDGASVFFESPGIHAWCNAETQKAGVELTSAEDDVVYRFSSLAIMSIVLDLALTRGWYGMHAAAVALNGKAILLPGDSGRGKSTIYKNAAAAGFDTLSDDLVWLRETADGIEIRPLPRGSLDAAAPDPSIDKAALAAIVCPTIVETNDNRLESIPLPDLLQTLADQSGFLAPGQTAQRFTMLTRIARSAPAYRLAAGRDQPAVPALLRTLLSQSQSAGGAGH